MTRQIGAQLPRCGDRITQHHDLQLLQTTKKPPEGGCFVLVAGVGFEPTTFRL